MRRFPLLAVLALTACTSAPQAAPLSSPPTVQAPPPSPPRAPPSLARAPKAHEPASAEAKRAAQHMNAFALELFAQARDATANQAISPLSVSYALHMLNEGARGDSRARLDRALHVQGDDAQQLTMFMRTLARETRAQQQELAITNGLFVRAGLSPLAEFVRTLDARYGAPTTQLDFATDPLGSMNKLNTWFKQATEGRIDPMLAEPLSSDTQLVLANAVYMKTSWKRPFEKSETEPAPFKVQGKREVQVPTMHKTAHHLFGYREDVRVLELPYRDSPLAMDFFLPARPDGLDAFEKSLTRERFDELVSTLVEIHFPVSVPKFKLEAPAVSLVPALGKLGLSPLFTPQADLSGIAGAPGALRVADVLHKTFLEVDERGSEAAAGTAVIIEEAGYFPEPEFFATHPFMFAIRDTDSGAILFVGHVVDPRGT